MRARHFSRVNSCSDYKAFLLRREFFRLIMIYKQVLVLELLIFIHNMLFWRDGEKFNRSALYSFDDVWSFEVNIRLLFALLLDLIEKSIIISVGPGIEESEEYFLVRSYGVFKRPLYPSLVEFLNKLGLTMRDKSILWAILFQSVLLSSLKTGRSP